MSSPYQTVFPLQYYLPNEVNPDGSGGAGLEWPEGLGPFGQRWEVNTSASLTSVHWQPGVLSAEECAIVTGWGRQRPPHSMPLDPGASAQGASHLTWIEPTQDNTWLFHRIGALFRQANRRFGFELVGLVDALQFAEYGPGPDLGWHMDIGNGQTSLRKLSLVVQLSPPDDYDGGDQNFVGLLPNPEARTMGSGVFFPSYLGQRTTPITRGSRCALLAWASGGPFR